MDSGGNQDNLVEIPRKQCKIHSNTPQNKRQTAPKQLKLTETGTKAQKHTVSFYKEVLI